MFLSAILMKITHMIGIYFKSAWRNLLHGKSFSFINILGLSIGMGAVILIVLWLQFEIGYDRFHTNKGRLFAVYGLTAAIDGHSSTIPDGSQLLAPALKTDFPEVEAATRVKELDRFLITANGKRFNRLRMAFVDPSFLDMFSFPLAQGNDGEQLKNVYSVTITQGLAKKLFGEAEALGQVIRIDSVDQFTVTGVLKDLPANTRFDFEYLLPFDYLKKLGQGYSNESWLSNNTPTYVQLKAHTDIPAFNQRIKDLSRIKTGRKDIWTHFLFPLQQWHLYDQFENGKPIGGRIDTVRLFAIIAAFILLVACINFTNLSTARSEKRAKEVGIRKVAGAGRLGILLQFLTEALLISVTAAAIAIAFVLLILPYFNLLVKTDLKIPFQTLQFWLAVLAFILVTSFIAGTYPALLMASYQPIAIFRKVFRRPKAGISPRKVLVVLQFSFAIVLIISTITVRNQLQYVQGRDRGYVNNNLVRVDFDGDIELNYEMIRNELLRSGIAVSVTKNMTGIEEGGAHTWGLRWPGEAAADTNTTITLYSADVDFVKTAGLKLLAGRDLDIYAHQMDSNSVLLNEKAVKLMGFRDPVGQVISTSYNNTKLTVVGVVKDYVAGSPYEAIPPTVIQGPGAWFNTLHIRLNPTVNISDNLAKAENIFKRYNPAYPFDYKFTDQEYAKRFEDGKRTKTMAAGFAGLAIFISCLGLFGLSAYVAESRVKEIGVRKVLGASAFGITRLLSSEFIRLVGIAILIASPIAWYTMDRWLQGYVYRTDMDASIFLQAALLSLAIALFTVSYQAIKAAFSNPIKSLRTE